MKLKSLFAKSAFTAVIAVSFGTTANAVDNNWTGTTSANWNDATNWSLGRVPTNTNGATSGDTFDDAVINTQTPNYPIVTANISATPRDVKVGLGGGANGRVDHISGDLASGPGNWFYVAHGGGTGVYNLADTTGTGGTLTGFAQGSGNVTSNRLWVGGVPWWGGGNGTVNINTSGKWDMNDLAIGINNGTGVMNVDAGTLNTTGWNFIGKNDGGGNGIGTLNMSGGTLNNTGRTYMGQSGCNGTLNLTGGSYINVNTGWGDNFFTVGDGTGGVAAVNITNSASLLQTSGEFWVGNGSSSGTMTLSAGTLITGSWTCIARAGGTATVTMSGGTWNKTGGGNFLVGDNSVGVMHHTGGDLTINGEFWVGQAGSANGTYNFSGGTHTENNWVAIGRDGGTGTVTMTGGTWTKTGSGNFIVAASGPGTMNQSGGLVDVQSGETWMGENNTCNYTLSGTGEFRAVDLYVGRWGGSSTVNLNGGTLRVGRIIGGNAGTKTVNFEGTQIIARSTQTSFISNLASANIGSGGLKIDSGAFNITSPQAFSGTGGVVKSGSGTLVLSGANSYGGANQVNNGKLVLTTASTGTGDITLANSTALGVNQTVDTASLSPVNATFGASGNTTLDIDLGNIIGNPTAAPLNVTGTLTLNGQVTVNVTDALPATGTVPLVSYVGPKAGSGSFVLGTLPNGVAATLNDDGSLVSLNVTSVALPIWTGLTNNDWDIATTDNWIDGVTNLPSTYTDLAPVLFDDTAIDPLVDLGTTVTPSKVTFNNSTLDYTLQGTGKITGTCPLVKQGGKSLAITLTGNDYTGSTTIEGGTVSVAALANGGSPSSIGASSSAASNLTLGVATLNYTGASVATDRGFTTSGTIVVDDENIGSVISTANDLTFSGEVACINGNLAKTGNGNLTLSYPGANVLGTANPGARVDGGTLTLSGSGTQTNSVGGELFIGSVANVPANLVLDSTTLNVQSWIAVGRGNGNTNTVSTLTATNSTITSGNFSSGWDDGRPNNSVQIISLTNSTWTNSGASQLAESVNATATMTLTDSTYSAGNFRAAMSADCEATVNLLGNSTVNSNGQTLLGQGDRSKVTMTVGGTSTFNANGRLQISLRPDSNCTVTIQDNGKIIKTGEWFSIGNDGPATMTVKDSGSLWANGDFNIGDVGTSDGTLNVMGSATVTSENILFVGKNTGTKGTLVQTGGTVVAKSWTPVGRYNGAIGVLDVSGGTFSHTNGGTVLFASEEGTGTITVSGTGVVETAGTLMISNGGTAVGVVNLNGGTLTARQITEGAGGAGMGTFNFNGGMLVVGSGANANFMNTLDVVNVEAGGAFINTNGQDVAINQSLGFSDAGTGGLTKSGTGVLYLNGVHTYTGTTTVNAGTLAGTGNFTGPITVANGANLNPGVTTGTMYAGPVTFAAGSTFTVDIAATPDTLEAGLLDVSGAALALNGTPTLPAYVIATYTTLTGTFTSVPTLPSGYSIDYAYNGGTAIAITRPVTAYESWAATNITGIDPGADATPGGDPDGDGATNIAEFALNGNPMSGAANRKVVGKVATVNGASALVLTLPVRDGATFSGATEQVSALIDGVIYKIQGSDDLGTWGLAITEVLGADKAAIEAAMPEATSAGWTYRTFRTPGTVAEDAQDFIRAVIATE
ncbi:MAG: autotransporter-associated beta strand repeat-containing protein [Verrucomicrobia bacterium]|nr:autotransporter-associated beta strand repeat-containing protein [Verrucomicrobiota bacterium]